MKIENTTVEKTASLSKLFLSNDDKTEMSKSMSEILSYVEKINELDTKNINPTDFIVAGRNVFRSDETKTSLDISLLEKMAPEFENSFFVVPKIIDGE